MSTETGKETETKPFTVPSDGSPQSADTNGLQFYFFNIVFQLFNFLGFGNDNAQTGDDFFKDLAAALAPENLVNNRLFQRAQNDDIQSELRDNCVSPERAAEIAAMPENREIAIRAAINQGFEQYTEQHDNLRYKFGAKDGVRSIDCSGFVKKALDQAADQLGGSCRSVFNASMATHSDGQIAAAEAAGASVLSGDQVNMENLKPGMIIGMDTRKTGWDAGRKRGIDHIVLVYEDSETGELMIGQSSSSGGGVNSRKASEWLEANQHKRLYAVDMVPLVRQEYGPGPGMDIASGQTPPEQQPSVPAPVPGA